MDDRAREATGGRVPGPFVGPPSWSGYGAAVRSGARRARHQRSAARPSEQLTRTLSVNGLPTSPTYRNPTAQTIGVVDGDLWLHGFNFGVTATY